MGDDPGGISAHRASEYVNQVLAKLRHPSCLREMSQKQAGKHEDELRINLATAYETIDKVRDALLLNGLTAEKKLLSTFEIAGLRLSDLELSPQVETAIGRDCFIGIRVILSITTYAELGEIKGIGDKSADEVIAKMRDLGFVEWVNKMDAGRVKTIG